MTIMDWPNPFNVTKAVDFTDQEIHDYWVDIADKGGFSHFTKPQSAMPMLILGGKGSGKTHLMRYISYATQRLKRSKSALENVRKDGYLGIYFRCGGLNARRFTGKGQTEDAWETVFAYYMDLWLPSLLLEIVQDAFHGSEELPASQGEICGRVAELFTSPPTARLDSISALMGLFARLQKDVDITVNNCAVTQKLDVEILVRPSELVFGVPRILAECLPSLRKVLFLYLVDEFENLTEEQQRYVNTLVREKTLPTSFKVGARLYGVRTYRTFSADEENKDGSEFETLTLDALLRQERMHRYKRFARRLCAQRICAAGYLKPQSLQSVEDSISQLFEEPAQSRCGDDHTEHIANKYEGQYPHMRRLKSVLAEGAKARSVPGVRTKNCISQILKNVARPKYPLLEKANIFLLYRAWNCNSDLIEASAKIGAMCDEYVADGDARSYREMLGHFRADLMAQLLRECDLKQQYLGMDTFIAMSDGLPRNLLTVLKHVFKWAVFNGERPFCGEKISARSQQLGAREASDWFYHDARMVGSDGGRIRDSVDRLATLFREVRFSDKPTECSLCTFSANLTEASAEACRMIELCEQWSLLIQVSGGQRDRNVRRVDAKFQLNPMLAPRWDLPVYRRGAIALTTEEIRAVFDTAYSTTFKDVLARRISRMTAPFFGKKQNRTNDPRPTQDRLPGIDND